MKTKLYATFCILHSAFCILLITTPPRASAQSDTVTVSAADFQRLVYSAHLHTQLALKPELEASLRTLLEMQRRNPNASPAALADLERQALQLYRTNAPAYIRTNGYPDEILAAYLDARRQIPAPTNFVPINLTMLNNFMLGAADYNYFTSDTVWDLINSADQRLSSTEGEAIKRQALVDNCVARAQANAAFATALDSLLSPETLVSLADTPAEIIGNTNSPLHNDLTMTNLLALSEASGDGSLTVSTNQLMNLFTNEMQTMWDTIHTNLAVLAQVNQSNPDLLAYLTNQAAIDANVRLVAAVQQGQPAKLACATAAVLVQSKLLPDSAETEQLVSAGGDLATGAAFLLAGWAEPQEALHGLEPLFSGGLEAFNMFSGNQSPQDVMAAQISNIQTLVGDLSTNMNYRFDRVDQSLTTIFNTMNQQFSQIDITLGEQGQQIAILNGNVYDIRHNLVEVQSSLDRIEAETFAEFSQQQQDQIVGPIDNDLLYTVQYPPTRGPFPEVGYEADEGLFYKYAMNDANDITSSPSSLLDLSASDLQQQLTARTLDANLNYIQQFLTSTLNVNTVGTPGNPFYLSNPQEWFIAAYAYLQLAGENPMYFRKDASQRRVSDIISRGQNVANFCGSLTFTGTNINWPLYTALESCYLTDLSSFNDQVSDTEGQYATNNNFALGTWRSWDAAAPRVTATATESLLATPKSLIAGGGYHSLALKADGTVVGWGANTYGQTAVPTGLTNAVAVAAGGLHSLALQADGTVVGWGGNAYGQATGATNGAPGLVTIQGQFLTNVVAIAAGDAFSLALRADGTVIGWGDNSYGQTNIPVGLTSVAAIAAGAAHGLALRADGTVVGWGASGPPASTYALSFDGLDDVVTVTNQDVLNAYPLTLSAWIQTTQADSTQTSIINKYASSSNNGYQLFLVNGNIHAWYFEGATPTGYSGVFGGGAGMDGGFVADGQWHHVAFVVDDTGGQIFVDGTLKASMPWTGTPGPTTTAQPLSLGTYPGGISGGFYSGLLDEVCIWNMARSQAEIQGDMLQGLTGTEPGLLAYWKLDEGTGVTATNSAAATGSACNGQLSGPAWVTVWGQFGQATVPAGLSNVVTIAAGYCHSLALRNDGTVIAWGDNTYGQTNVPPDLEDVVAIAGGGSHSSALKADGTVVGWGAGGPGTSGGNNCGQTTIPTNLNNVVAIAAGQFHSLALKADGTAVGWGLNNYGQSIARGWSASPLVRNHIAAGAYHSLALKADGSVVAWGYNDYGQTTIPNNLRKVLAVAAGYDFSLVLTAGGTVVGWGDNNYGQTTIPNNLNNVVAIAAGAYHSLALQANGTVVAWGDNLNGQITIPNNLSNVVAIAAGAYYSLALTAGGTVVGWGDNQYGQISIPASATNVVAITADLDHSLALQADGTVVAAGSDFFGEINIPNNLNNVVAIAAGYYHNLALQADGTVVGWGNNQYGQINSPVGLSNVVAIAAGFGHSLAIQADGTVVGWGAGEPGTSGFPNDGQTTIPANMVDLGAWGEHPPGLWSVPQVSSPITAVAAGSAHCVAVTAGGSVLAWGLNTWGQTNVPPQAQSGVQAVAAGFEHSLALLTNGSVLAWGLDDVGQTNVPANLTNVVAISAGGKHNLALSNGGTVVAWGMDNYGQTNVPATVGTNVVQGQVLAIAAGGEHSLALRGDGTVVGWGDNDDGQATGDPSVASPNFVAVGGQTLSGVVAIAAGRYHSLALEANGGVVAWGLNYNGQCNVPAVAQSGVVAIAAGITHSLALKADGTVVVWGSGPAAFLPPQAWNNVVAIAAGDQHSLLLRTSTPSDTNSIQTLSLVLAQIPPRVGILIQSCNQSTIDELSQNGSGLDLAAESLSGAKALLADVLELGMPYTLANDEVLHGFLYGSESLTDTGIATNFLQTQNAQLQASPNAPAPALVQWDWLSYLRFQDRLNQCLTNLQATGQPEIPRLVGHTLRLLNLLCDAWTPPTNSPPPALEMWTTNDSPSLLLYGEPYMQYTLQYRDGLNVPGWTTTTTTNWQDEQVIAPPVSSGTQRFYRAMLPMP
jgi:alpha-tubulin suppressor-like RCC1 family protein